MKERSRLLRKNQTDVEIKLWSILRNKKFYGFKFRRQYCIACYIVDFICFEYKLIIELDGSQHLLQAKYDLARDNYLRENGYKVLRFWNNEVLQNLESVLKVIYEHLTSANA